MRAIARHWARLLGWLTARKYLVDRHASVKAQNAALRKTLADEVDRSNRLVSNLAHESLELKDVRQQLEIARAELDVAKHVIDVQSKEYTLLQERYNTLIADQIRRRFRPGEPDEDSDL